MKKTCITDLWYGLVGRSACDLSSKPVNLRGGTRAPTPPSCPLTFIHTLGHKWYAHTNKCQKKEEMKTCNVFETKKNTDFFC